ncbi:MAG: helix-turn-helix domain-containing protein [Anaerolineales bacterium]|nr:helix-turn-helix domain-containing protein [Anaerolineales bacterium]MDW8161109.1 helix-turn-helix transcriptional regulator [Anaerolineales bacterium]
MKIDSRSIALRGRKLGVLLRNARQVAQKSLEETAEFLGIPQQSLEAYEFGETSPSLPQLESLAEFYRVPLHHFWSNELLPSPQEDRLRETEKMIHAVRQRIIGAIIRRCRQDRGISLENLAEQVGIEPSQLERYEMGEEAIPLPFLEAIALALDLKIETFYDRRRLKRSTNFPDPIWQEFQALPEELKEFVCKPINRPYLEVAQRLSEMSVEKLRAVAEGLLEITL